MTTHDELVTDIGLLENIHEQWLNKIVFTYLRDEFEWNDIYTVIQGNVVVMI